MISHKVHRKASGRCPLVLVVYSSALFLLAIGMNAASPGQAFAAKKESTKTNRDPRELQAREAFAAGRFREALDLYAKLYAERLHPTYLRNIGRCHQNMGNPEDAIISFRDYLRKASPLPASEREEVEGFIKEMEALQEKHKQAETRPPEPTIVPPPVAPVPEPPAAQPAGVNLQNNDRPAPPEPDRPFYRQTWFWVATGLVVVGGVVGGLWAGGVFSKSSGCRAGYDCQASSSLQ